jgi:septal ring factor EnvC (AmiA/AmiB activator)
MNRPFILPLLVALLLVPPASSQDNQGQVEDLQTTIVVLKEKIAAQDAQLKKIEELLAQQKEGAKELAKALLAAEKGGFAYPAPNPESREKLLKGLQRFALTLAGVKPEDLDSE